MLVRRRRGIERSVTTAVAAGTDPMSLTAANPPSLCINHNLKGADLSSGLGMLKRITPTARPAAADRP